MQSPLIYRICYRAVSKRRRFYDKTPKQCRFDFLNMQCFKLDDVVLIFYHQNYVVLGRAVTNAVNHAVNVALPYFKLETFYFFYLIYGPFRFISLFTYFVGFCVYYGFLIKWGNFRQIYLCL